MDIDILKSVLSENLDAYDRSVNGIKQCLPAFEKECSDLILEISSCETTADADRIFDQLLDIQTMLSGLLFKRRFDIGKKLEDLTREFDRLDDQYIRDYWFKKFKDGETWPEST